MTIAVCAKWVQPLHSPDDRFAGISAADQSALEFALRLAEIEGDTVTVVTAGPPAADAALRDALACGAHRAVRIDADGEVASTDVASAIATVVGAATTVWCGDYSLDRGSGSTPAFLAAHLGVGQALGLIEVELPSSPGGAITARRRLDGARREVLRIAGRAVLSVEGSTARLRRAPLRAVLAAKDASIEVVPFAGAPLVAPELQPYRPRARVLAAPHGDSALDRVRQLTAAGDTTARAETIELEPAAAAERIVAALRDWGYRP